MATKCFLVDDKATDDYWETPGAMFEIEYSDFDGASSRKALSAAYYRDHYGKRKPLALVLPDSSVWVVDAKASNEAEGWELSGEPPNVTARPSIDTGGYHGWLMDGVLSDDLDGRTYQEKSHVGAHEGTTGRAAAPRSAGGDRGGTRRRSGIVRLHTRSTERW